MYYTYSIKNLENGKFYIGSRTNKCMLTRKPEDDLGVRYFSSTTDKELKEAIKEGKVKYTVIQEYDDPKVCWRAEQQLIALYWKFFGKDMSYNHSYRICNTSIFSMNGTTHTASEYVKQRVSATQKGKPKSDEHKLKLSEIRKGSHLSEETKKKISDANKGKVAHNKGKFGVIKWSEEQKKKMSEARKGINNPMFGKKFTKTKFYFETPDGEIMIMSIGCAHRWHPDWKQMGPVE